jgi:pimeloyl-ACP methyl ester carboxylesterase
MELHFQSLGRGEPLIVLHGLFGSLDNWQHVARRLAARFEVLSLDQRNHGPSPHAAEMGYERMADDVRQFLDRRDIRTAHLLGHSMGGKTAMQFALLHPDRARTLAVVDIAPRAYAARHAGILEGLLALEPRRFATRRQMEEALAPSIPDLAVRQFLLKSVTRDANGVFDWRMGLREIQANYDRLSEGVRASEPFTGPALFVRGERSDYLREADLAAIQELFPRAVMRAVAGAGHWVQAENVEGLLQVLQEFWDIQPGCEAA